MGLFSGAFGAGLSKGLGEGIAKGIDERRKMQLKYVDNMMDTAKAYAPKYQAAAAEIDASLVQMNNLKRDFNISEAEYVALAQAHPNLDAIYKDIYVQKDALTAQGFGNKINRDTILKTLNLGEKGIELPEGMTAKEALRTIHLGIANNLSKDPTNKSEGFSNKSVSDAFASMFMMNPNSSAKQIVNNMQVAGVEVDDILAYERSGGVRGTVYDSVNASPFALPNIDYKADDMQTTRDRFTREANKKFALTDDITNLTDAGAFNKRVGGKDAAASVAITNEIGLNFAKLEKQLFSQSALFNSNINRSPMLFELLSYIDTPEDIKAFNNAVKNNTMASILIESFEKNQGLTDEYAKKIFDTDAAEEEEYIGSDYGDGNVIMPVESSTVTGTDDGDGTVAKILSNTKDKKSSVELKDLDLKDATFNTEENAWFDNNSGKKILDPKGILKNTPGFRALEDTSFIDEIMSLVGGEAAKKHFANKSKENDSVAKVEEKTEDKVEDKGIMTSPKLRPSDLKIENIIEENLEPEEASNLKEQFNANPKDSIWESIVKVMSSKEYAKIQSDKSMNEAIQKIKESRPELRTKRPDAIGFTLSNLRSILDSELPASQKAIAIKIMATIKPDTAGLKIGTK
jgi:hypothetical protein